MSDLLDFANRVKIEREGGFNRALTQEQHAEVNSVHPGLTLQYCDLCGDATGRCEEDAMYDDDGNTICENCA